MYWGSCHHHRYLHLVVLLFLMHTVRPVPHFLICFLLFRASLFLNSNNTEEREWTIQQRHLPSSLRIDVAQCVVHSVWSGVLYHVFCRLYLHRKFGSSCFIFLSSSLVKLCLGLEGKECCLNAMRTAIFETFPEPNRRLLQRCGWLCAFPCLLAIDVLICSLE